MSRPARLARTAVALLIGGSLACEGDSAVPGALTVSVMSPSGAEGAAVVDLFGPGLRAVSAIEGRVFSSARGDTVRVVVLREEPGQLRFSLEVDDVGTTPSGVVLEVAGGDDRIRGGLSSYEVGISR